VPSEGVTTRAAEQPHAAHERRTCERIAKRVTSPSNLRQLCYVAEPLVRNKRHHDVVFEPILQSASMRRLDQMLHAVAVK
jgi:hypothetical protein